MVAARGPVEYAQLRAAGDAAREGLLDVDVRVRVGRPRVLARVQRDGGAADDGAFEPGDALEGEDGVGVVGEGFVLSMGGVSLRWIVRGAQLMFWRFENLGFSTYHDPVAGEITERDFGRSCHCLGFALRRR